MAGRKRGRRPQVLAHPRSEEIRAAFKSAMTDDEISREFATKRHPLSSDAVWRFREKVKAEAQAQIQAAIAEAGALSGGKGSQEQATLQELAGDTNARVMEVLGLLREAQSRIKGADDVAAAALMGRAIQALELVFKVRGDLKGDTNNFTFALTLPIVVELRTFHASFVAELPDEYQRRYEELEAAVIEGAKR